MRNRRFSTALVVGIAVTLSACGSSAGKDPGSGSVTLDDATQALYEEAQAESGEVLVYQNGPDTLGASLTREFAHAFPDAPSLTAVTLPGSATTARYGAERDAGKCGAAAVLVTSTDTEAMIDKEWFLELTDEMIPARAEYDDEFLFSPYYMPVSAIPLGFNYNTDKIKTPPSSYADLVKDEYRGRIGLTDPRTFLTGVQTIYAMSNADGIESVEKLGQLEPQYFESQTVAASAVASGELDIIYPGYRSLSNALSAKGAPIGFSIPEQGASASLRVSAISAGDGCDHQASAKLFVHWLSSAAGQAVAAGRDQYGSLLPTREAYSGAEEYPAPVDGTNLTFPTQDELDAQKSRLLDALGIQ